MSRAHISEISSALFEAAVTASLAKLVISGLKFRVIDVVRNACYESGSPVGVTTIYAKGSNGKLIHEKLLNKLKTASARSMMVSSSGPAVSADEMGETGVPYGSAGLRRQLVEQEGRIQTLEAAIATVTHQMSRAQEDQYLAFSVLSQLTTGSVIEVAHTLHKLEIVLADQELLSALKERAVTLANRCRRLIAST